MMGRVEGNGGSNRGGWRGAEEGWRGKGGDGGPMERGWRRRRGDGGGREWKEGMMGGGGYGGGHCWSLGCPIPSAGGRGQGTAGLGFTPHQAAEWGRAAPYPTCVCPGGSQQAVMPLLPTGTRGSGAPGSHGAGTGPIVPSLLQPPCPRSLPNPRATGQGHWCCPALPVALARRSQGGGVQGHCTPAPPGSPQPQCPCPKSPTGPGCGDG